MWRLFLPTAAMLFTSCAEVDGDPELEASGFDPQVQAVSADKIDVCHYSADDDSYTLIRVSVNSAHLDPEKHPDDVKPGRWHPDLDGDGQGDRVSTFGICPESYDGWVGNRQDCDDDDASTYVGAQELCDGIDNDCDRVVDEGC